MTTPASEDYRAHIDFEISFANGGGLRGEGFRLDLPTKDLTERAVGELLVAHLGLALVESVTFHQFRVVREPRRGSRGVEVRREDTSPGTVLDLSHRIRAGLVTYPGLPAPTTTPHLTREASRASYEEGTEFRIDTITMVGNTGTYLDAPFHRYGDGADLAGLDLSTLVDLRAEVFHLADAWDHDRRGFARETFADRDLRGAAVLLHTGWSRHFGTEANGRGAPFLSGEAAAYLVEAGAVLVGIDSVNLTTSRAGAPGRRTRPSWATASRSSST